MKPLLCCFVLFATLPGKAQILASRPPTREVTERESLLIKTLQSNLRSFLRNPEFKKNPETAELAKSIWGRIAFYIYLSHSLPPESRVFGENAPRNQGVEFFGLALKLSPHPELFTEAVKDPLGIRAALETAALRAPEAAAPALATLMRKTSVPLPPAAAQAGAGGGVADAISAKAPHRDSSSFVAILPGYADFKGSAADLLKKYDADVKGFQVWIETYEKQRLEYEKRVLREMGLEHRIKE